jgi:membrane-associated phospholipid phosphatase
VYRFRGLSESIRELAGPVVTDIFAAVTRLGDPFFLLAVIAVYYWLSDERGDPAWLVAYTLFAVAVTVSLKNGLALPRPPVDVQAVPAEELSNGFPSGHALGATVVYGGLVAVDDRLQSVSWALGAGVLITLIALSRVVIGVHYVGDVVVGVAIGCAILGALWVVVAERRASVAAVAALCAVPGVVVPHRGTDAFIVLGGCLGAVGVFSLVDPVSLPAADTLVSKVTLVVGGGLLLGGAYGLSFVAGHPLTTVAAGAVMLGVALSLPLVLNALSPRTTANG